MAAAVLLLAAARCAVPSAQPAPAAGATLKLPPMIAGGIAGLPEPEHRFIVREYGRYELLNRANAGFTPGGAWTLAALGGFRGDSVSYATLARVEGHADGLLLLMFTWSDDPDTSRQHTVYYHTFLGKRSAALRVRQAAAGTPDTLEISCADT